MLVCWLMLLVNEVMCVLLGILGVLVCFWVEYYWLGFVIDVGCVMGFVVSVC